MATQIHDLAISARGYLLDPLLLVALTVVVLAIFTGFAGRASVLLEDLRYRHIHRHTG